MAAGEAAFLVCTLARLLRGRSHVAVGANSPIPGCAALLAQALSDGATRVEILGSRRYSTFSGLADLYDCASTGRLDAFFLSPGQIDGCANINMNGIGPYLMKEGGLPRPPLILGFILGPIMENSLFITNQAYGATGWLLRPVCMVLVCLIAGTLAYSYLSGHRRHRAALQTRVDAPQAHDPRWSLPLVVAILAWSAYSIWRALDWPFDAALFPIAIGVPAMVLGLLGVFVDWRALVQARSRPLDIEHDVVGAILFISTLLALLGAAIVIGQRLALLLFVAGYLVVWGKYSWRFALVYAGMCWLLLQVIFDQIVRVIWYPSLLFG